MGLQKYEVEKLSELGFFIEDFIVAPNIDKDNLYVDVSLSVPAHF